jgi:hypothetical protein
MHRAVLATRSTELRYDPKAEPFTAHYIFLDPLIEGLARRLKVKLFRQLPSQVY